MITKAVSQTALLMSVLATLTFAKRGFLFSIPAVLQQGTTERGCLTIQDLPNLRVIVELKKDNTTVLAETETLQGHGCMDIPIKATNVPVGEYELVVTGKSASENYSYTDTAIVKVEVSKNLVFIQSDKPIYKPGQTVKVRVLVVGADLKPRMEPISEIYIEDPNGVRMMQWLSVDVTQFQGIADLQMPLSTEPVQGAWKVSVIAALGDTVESVSIKVEEYVLPKYEIAIKPPGFVPINAKEVQGEVCAMYTYGEPVRGLLSLDACFKRDFYSWQRPNNYEPRCLTTNVMISGCHPFNVDVTSLEIDANRWGYSNGHIVFNAQVLENATGVTLNSTAKLEVTRELFQLNFSPYSSDSFKPGLPYHGKVKVTRPDNTPAPDETVEITVSNYRTNQEFNKRFISDRSGEVLFALPPLSDKDASISIKAAMPDYSYDYSEARLQPYTPSGYHSIKQWFSPSDSYLQIDPIEEVAGCGESINLNITHVMEEAPSITMFYQLMSKGNLLKSGKEVLSYSNSRKRVYKPDGTFNEDDFIQCPEGQEWSECSSGCVSTCEDPNPICGFSCVPRCQCPHPNFILHYGECITQEECPDVSGPPACSGGRVRRSCGSACTPTCENQTLTCTQQCVDRCVCPPKKPLWHESACVSKESCPGYVPPPDPNKERFIVSLPLTVEITADMSPEVKLIVYYVREDGETVADSTSINVAECTNNQVELKFTQSSLYPGESATLSLEAAPGSACSVGAVDKSVSLLGGNKALTLSQVLSRLAEFQLTESSIPGEDTYCEEQVLAREAQPPGGPPDPVPRNRPPIRRQQRSVIRPGNYYSQYYDSMRAFKITQIIDLKMEVRAEPVTKLANSTSTSTLVPPKLPQGPVISFDTRGRLITMQECKQTMGNVVIGDVVLETRPCSKRPGRVLYSALPLPVANAEFNGGDDIAYESAVYRDTGDVAAPTAEKKTLDVRTYFPETWLWDLHFVGPSGSLTLTEKLPHTVTEWIASSICSQVEQGIGVSQITAIKGFQPFFLSLTLPVSVIRGEVLKLPVTVFNYLSECLVVKVSLRPSDEYTIVGNTESEHCVCGQESATAYFRLRFAELGEIPIKVGAESVDNNGVCGNSLFMSDQIGVRDAVERPLLVEAEGREEEMIESQYVCPEGNVENLSVKLDLPDDYVHGTPRATVSVIGDIMGPTLTGLDQLVRLPMGCGEQNMILFAPNIYVMHYLKSTGQVTKEIEEKALGYMKTGYQRELTYRHDDGSYSAFGKSDESGSTWLTAYVMKSFAQAKRYIFIDTEDLKKSVNWLMSKQISSGCFTKVGNVIHKDMKGGVDGGASLTTFILVALLESRPHVDIPGVNDTINKAFHCLELESVTDTYTLALLANAYALSGRNSPHSQQVYSTLKQRAIQDDGMMHWTRDMQEVNDTDIDEWEVRPIHPPTSLDVEITAYSLMSVIASEGDEAVIKGLPMVKWLSAQRNAYGGFSSTQDTVVALQALAQYASLVFSGGSDLTVSASSSQAQELFQVTDDNRLLLQRKEFTVPTEISFDVAGSGCALIQTTLKYNVPDISRGQPAFTLTVSANRHEKCKVRTMNVCARYDGTDGSSSMTVIEVKMVSGWIPDKSSIKALLNEVGLNLKKYELEMNRVNFYFDELTFELTCFSFLIEQHVEVDGVKPGKAEVYDYYENIETRVTEAYEIKPICGTKEELPFIDQEEYDEMNNRDPSMIEQVRQPVGRRPTGTKEDLPHLTEEEYGKMNMGNGRDIEQRRRPEPNPGHGTKEDLPTLTEEEYNRRHQGNPDDIEQMRQPNPNPGRGTKEDLPTLTEEEYDRMHQGDPDNIEQARVPVPPISREDIIGDNFREEVNEPLIVPEEVIPLGNEDLCPVCFDSVPDSIGQEMCQHGLAYKAVFRNNQNVYRLKLLHEFIHKERNLKLSTQLILPDGCECEELNYRQNGKILILNPEGSGAEREHRHPNRASLTLSSTSKVYRLPNPRHQLRTIETKLNQATCR